MEYFFPSSHSARAVTGAVAVRALALPIAALAAAIGLVLSLPVTAARAATVGGAIAQLESGGAIDAAQASAARRAYIDARVVRRHAGGAGLQAMSFQIRRVESLARVNRITGDRVRPLFETLQRNADWFRNNGPRPYGTDNRFGDSRIIYEYFPGQGWEFHPLSNFAKLNAVWMVKTTPARRALGKYAHELISWAVNRGGALTWEYYFPFSGSRAPFISSISQGTAIQALARAGNALQDPVITAAARQAMLAFDTPAPVGLKVTQDVGNEYLGYSGNPRLKILNMFLQALDGLHDFSVITNDAKGWDLYREGLKGARRDTAASDTGAWSLYNVGGNESDLHYHELVIGFLQSICGDTHEDVFCTTQAHFDAYLHEPPRITRLSTKVRRGRLLVKFRLSKISNVVVSAARGGRAAASAKAMVGYGERHFSFKKPNQKGLYSVSIVAVDLAGNRGTFSAKLRVK